MAFRSKPIQPEEIVDAFKARIIRECKNDDGEVHLSIATSNIKKLRQDLISSFWLDNIPVVEFDSNKIRVGIVYIHFTEY